MWTVVFWAVLAGIVLAGIAYLLNQLPRVHVPVPIVLIILFILIITSALIASAQRSEPPSVASTTVPPQSVPSTGPQGVPPEGWLLAIQQGFDYPDGTASPGLVDRCTESHANFEKQRLVLRLDSCRDYTYQVGYESQPRRVAANFYFRADVQYISGPTDGYCVLLFGWKDHEHWYAFKLGRDSLEVTRNKGVLPHQILEGPRTDPVITPGRVHRLTFLSQGSQATFYINGSRVSQQEIASSEGETRLGVQAANRSDLVRCAFDNVELWLPS